MRNAKRGTLNLHFELFEIIRVERISEAGVKPSALSVQHWKGILIGEPKATIGKTYVCLAAMCRAGIKRKLSMALVPQKLSVTAKQVIDHKRRIRSAALPCFCKLPNEARPFFRQWHIHAIDVSKINSVSYAEARQIMQRLRSYYGKLKREPITIEEFSEYTGKSKSLVRMVVVSRTIEHELRRQCNMAAVPELKTIGQH